LRELYALDEATPISDVPADPEEWNDKQQARWLLVDD
jgi:hypothetical protein